MLGGFVVRRAMPRQPDVAGPHAAADGGCHNIHQQPLSGSPFPLGRGCVWEEGHGSSTAMIERCKITIGRHAIYTSTRSAIKPPEVFVAERRNIRPCLVSIAVASFH